VTPVPGEAEVVRRLRAAGCVFAEDEARLLRSAATGPALEALVVRRVAGEPLEQVLGWASFGGLRVAVRPGVFVPRRRTELLAREAVSVAGPGSVVVDLCCGCGAVGLVVATALPGVELHAADVDPAAVACARDNLAGLGVGGAVHVGDLDSALPDRLRGRVGVLAANVPYVPTAEIALMPPEAREHEPPVALDGGADGLDVARRVVVAAPGWLAPGGHVLVETSRRQAATLAATVEAVGLEPRVVTDDGLGGTVVIGRLG
jgi:release factor glutamine methyltransferase